MHLTYHIIYDHKVYSPYVLITQHEDRLKVVGRNRHVALFEAMETDLEGVRVCEVGGKE
jgi:hypothetical protein